MKRRVTIDRLELKLRGVAPQTAEAAARLLGEEIARALRPRAESRSAMESKNAMGTRNAIGTIDAGRLETPPRAGAAALARDIGAHIAKRIGEGRS